jgi:hypothetical protein
MLSTISLSNSGGFGIQSIEGGRAAYGTYRDRVTFVVFVLSADIEETTGMSFGARSAGGVVQFLDGTTLEYRGDEDTVDIGGDEFILDQGRVFFVTYFKGEAKVHQSRAAFDRSRAAVGSEIIRMSGLAPEDGQVE